MAQAQERPQLQPRPGRSILARLQGEGIIVQRPGQNRIDLGISLIPRDDTTVDVLEVSYTFDRRSHPVNSAAWTSILQHYLPLVAYKRQDELTPRGVMPSATIEREVRRIPADRLPEALRELDEGLEREELPKSFDEKLLLDLKAVGGFGYKLPKRFYSTQVLLTVEKPGGGEFKALAPLTVASLLLRESPELIGSAWILPRFRFIIVELEGKLDLETVKYYLHDNVGEALSLWEKLRSKVTLLALAQEEE